MIKPIVSKRQTAKWSTFALRDFGFRFVTIDWGARERREWSKRKLLEETGSTAVPAYVRSPREATPVSYTHLTLPTKA